MKEAPQKELPIWRHSAPAYRNSKRRIFIESVGGSE